MVVQIMCKALIIFSKTIKQVNITEVVIKQQFKLQFKLPQALISRVLPEGQYFMPLLFSKKGLID